jgi:hypothetical protein
VISIRQKASICRTNIRAQLSPKGCKSETCKHIWVMGAPQIDTSCIVGPANYVRHGKLATAIPMALCPVQVLLLLVLCHYSIPSQDLRFTVLVCVGSDAAGAKMMKLPKKYEHHQKMSHNASRRLVICKRKRGGRLGNSTRVRRWSNIWNPTALSSTPIENPRRHKIKYAFSCTFKVPNVVFYM